MVDALKPKLKFDSAGMGLNRAEEFEFHWWDHVFNSAAKGISVNESKGEVIVEFKAGKADISAKKLRRKMQKEIRNKLYSHFVKAGTMTGAEFVNENNEDIVEEVKDLSKLKTLTDKQLVDACGGRTAHKGARHGHNMTSKLKRIEDSEARYLEELTASIKAKEEEKARIKANKEAAFQAKLKAVATGEAAPAKAAKDAEEVLPTYLALTDTKAKKKKKKKDKDKNKLVETDEKENTDSNQNQNGTMEDNLEKEFAVTEPRVKQRKKKSSNEAEELEPTSPKSHTSKKSKKRKREKEDESENIQATQVVEETSEVPVKPKKSKKKKKNKALE